MCLASLSVLSACSSSDSADASGIDVATQGVDGLLAASSAAMADIDTVRFTISHEGVEVFIDDAGLIAFNEAVGRYASPSSADALVAVSALGIATEIGAVAIEGEVWITNPLTSAWESAPDAFAFDPARIFDPDVGLSSLLVNGLTSPELISDDPDSDGNYHIQAGVDGGLVSELTSGLVDDVSNVDVWIDAETSLVAAVSFDVDTTAGNTNWLLTLADYGTDVSISKPDLG